MKLFKWLFTHNLNYENFIHKISHNLKRLCSIALVVGGKSFLGAKSPIMNNYVKYNPIPNLKENQAEFLMFS